MHSIISPGKTGNDLPWHGLVEPSYWELSNDFSHGLDLFEDALANSPDAAAIKYFDASITFRELDEASTAIALAILDRGFKPGDRLALYMQNIPAFTISMLAAWKAGGSVIPINPMNRTRELAIILNDARPHTLVLEPDLLQCYADLESKDYRPSQLLIASPYDYQCRDDPRVLPAKIEALEGQSFLALLQNAQSDHPPSQARLPGDPAFLVYTSGTTGIPKAAVITHSATGRSSAYARRAYQLENGQPVLALAPVFHVTGLMCTLMTAFNLRSALIMTYRFHPDVAVEAIRDHRPAFTAASPTAFIALTQAKGAEPAAFESFQACAIGGAAVSPALIDRLQKEFGVPAQTGYGMTETAGAVAITPIELRHRTPIDPATGALSVGLPLPGVEMWIAGEAGERLLPGEVGEIIVRAPTTMTEYWQRPEATAEALRSDGLRTGDVGFMDASGWFYLIDRKKDMIVAGGYKVWPREIEDVLYAHPGVLEVAVVGVPDEYRGETVKAYVRLRSEGSASIEGLQDFCCKTMAAYKRPREFVIVDDLPKTATGKIQRSALR